MNFASNRRGPWSKRRLAHDLRMRPTDTERVVWELVRAKRLGVHFRRQHPLRGFVLDFHCVSRRLAVEVDGACHDIAYDHARDVVLSALGVRTLRIRNDDVVNQLPTVLARIRACLHEPLPHIPMGEGTRMRDPCS